MEYRFTIKNFDSGLNELLNGVHYDYKRRTVVNYEKAKWERVMMQQIRMIPSLKNVKFKPPIAIHYDIFAKDKRHDRMNIGSAADKVLQDVLQKAGLLDNDSWDNVVDISFKYYLDRQNPRIEVTITEIEDEKAPKSISAVFDEFDSIMDKYSNDNFGLKYHANRSLKQGVKKGKNDDNHISTE